MPQWSVLRNQLPELRNLFAFERSLLLPMTVLALGIHAALLALPIPSNEALKTPDDQKNPIKVTQIPTEKPPEVVSSTGVAIPPLDTPSVPSIVSSASTSEGASSTTGSSGQSDPSDSPDSSDSSESPPSGAASDTVAATPSSKPAAVSPTKRTTKSTSTKVSAKPSDSSTSVPEKSSDSSAGDAAATTEPATEVVEDTAATTSGGGVSAVAFANFPQFKASMGDCFGLGLGDNCRVVENGAIAEVTNYFRKELAAKQFKAELVTDEPTRKVFKVSKNDKTLFLNILQSKQNVVYLLSSVVYKQSPDAITEKGQ